MLDRIGKGNWELYVLWYRAPPKTVCSIWYDMPQLWQGQPFSGSMQVSAEAAARPEVTTEWRALIPYNTPEAMVT